MECVFTPKGHTGKPMSYDDFRQFLLENPKYWADVAQKYAPEVNAIHSITEADIKAAKEFAAAQPQPTPTPKAESEQEGKQEQKKEEAPKQEGKKEEAPKKEQGKEQKEQGEQTPLQKAAQAIRDIASRLRETAYAAKENAAVNVSKALNGIGVKTMLLSEDDFRDMAERLHARYGTKNNPAADGWFFYADGVIVVNKDVDIPGMPNVVLFHEATHPIINIIRNADPKLYNTLINGLKEFRKNNPKQFESVDLFLEDSYDPRLTETENKLKKDDEMIVETIAQIASGNIDIKSMPIGLKQALVNFINKVLDALAITDKRLKDTSDVMTFIRLANDVAIALKEGKDVRDQVFKGRIDISNGYSLVPNLSPQARARTTGKKKAVISDSPLYFQNVKDFASEAQTIENKIDFKNQLIKKFDKVLPKLKKAYGDMLDPSKMNDLSKQYIVDAITQEAYDAILSHPEAIGWYNEKTKLALEVVSLIHPEISTDRAAKGAFIFALAVTSNGNKVDANFDLAEKQYRIYKETGKFNPKAKFGAQQSGIRKSFKLVNELLEQGISMDDITDFFTTKYTVGELKKADKKGNLKNIITGELVSEEVFGAAVLGSKIGNGFYMNLWGEYGQLTMDRWFMRTWGRVTGTLIKKDAAKLAKNKAAYEAAYDIVKKDKQAKAMLDKYLKTKSLALTDSDKKVGITKDTKEALVINKIFTSAEVRAELNDNEKIDEFRKAVNNYAKNLFGEIEAPASGTQRKFIRDVFADIQKKLKEDYNIDIEMADLQAVLWYPEKILYESFKKGKTYEGIYETYKQKEKPERTSEDITEEDDVVSGPPDYLNASIKLAQKNGISNNEIQRRIASARESLGLDTGERDTATGKGDSAADQRTKAAVTKFYSAEPEVQASYGRRTVRDNAVATAFDAFAKEVESSSSIQAAYDKFKSTDLFKAINSRELSKFIEILRSDNIIDNNIYDLAYKDYNKKWYEEDDVEWANRNNVEIPSDIIDSFLKMPQVAREQLGKSAQASVGKRHENNTDIISTKVNVAPLYSVKVNSIEQTNSIIASPLYQKYKENISSVAKALGLKVTGTEDGMGGFAFDDGTKVKEATTVVGLEGKWEDVVKFAALLGVLTPEAQESTIATRYTNPNDKNHNGNEYIVDIDNSAAALRAIQGSGFDSAGFTLEENKVIFLQAFGVSPDNFKEMIATFVNKFKEYGGQIIGKRKRSIEIEYIDYDRRGAILAGITRDAVQLGSNWASIRDRVADGFERNKAFAKWKKINKGIPAEEYRRLRREQIEAGEKGEILSDEKLKRIKDIEELLVNPVARVFSSDEKQYLEAKAEIEAIAEDVAKLVSGSFTSPFGIKRPQRSAIKVARWYSINPNLLGDGSRTNIIVNTDADADFLFNEIKNRYAMEGDRVEYDMPTKLGYPKRLIEIRTSNGKIAEIQVMTQQGYLAKDGVKFFEKNVQDLAKSALKQVQDRLGWKIPDGVGHYFYEIERDTNVPMELRNEAIEVSNQYYDAFLNENSTLTDSQFREQVSAFKEKVDAADKKKWDSTNKGEAPGPLLEYLSEGPQASTGKRTTGTTAQQQALPASVKDKIRDIIAKERVDIQAALKKIKNLLNGVKTLSKEDIDKMLTAIEERIGAKTEAEYFFDYVKEKQVLKKLSPSQANALIKQFRNFILSPEDLANALDFVDRLAKNQELLEKVNQAKQAFRMLKAISKNKKLSKADKLFLANLASPKFYLCDESELIKLREMALNFISSRLNNGQQKFTMAEIDAAYNEAAVKKPLKERAKPAVRIRPNSRPVIEIAVKDALRQYAPQISAVADLLNMDLSVLDTEVLYKILNALKMYDETGVLFDIGQITEMARALNDAKSLKTTSIRTIFNKLAAGGISAKLQSISASAADIRRILVGGWDRKAGRVTSDTQTMREAVNQKFAELKIGLPERFLLGAYGFLKEVTKNTTASFKAGVLADQMNYLKDRIDNAKKYSSSPEEIAMLTHYYKGAVDGLLKLGAIKDVNGQYEAVEDFDVDANVPDNVRKAWEFGQNLLQEKTQQYGEALRMYHGRDFDLIQEYWPRSYYKVERSSGDMAQGQSDQLPQMGNIDPVINKQSTDISERNKGRSLMPRSGGFYIMDGYETMLNGLWDINATIHLSKEYAYSNTLINKASIVSDAKTDESVKKYLISSISGILRDPMIFPDTRSFWNRLSDTAINTITSTILNNFTQYVKQRLATVQGFFANMDASIKATSLMRQAMGNPALADALNKFFNNTSAPYAEQMAYNELENKYYQGDYVSDKARGFLDKISPEWLLKANQFTQKQLLLTGYLAERGIGIDFVKEAAEGFNETALASAENFAEAANSTANRHFLPMEIKNAKAYKKWLYFLSTYTFVATAQFWNNMGILTKPGYTGTQKKMAALQAIGFLGQQVAFQIATRGMREVIREIGQALGWLEEEDEDEEAKNREKYWYQILAGVGIDTLVGPYASIVGDSLKTLINSTAEWVQDEMAETDEEAKERLNLLYAKQSELPGAYSILEPLWQSGQRAIKNGDPTEAWALALQATGLMLKIGDLYFLAKTKVRSLESIFATADSDKLLRTMRSIDSGQYKDWVSELRKAGVTDKMLSKMTYKAGDMGYYVDAADAKKFVNIYENSVEQYSKMIKQNVQANNLKMSDNEIMRKAEKIAEKQAQMQVKKIAFKLPDNY